MTDLAAGAGIAGYTIITLVMEALVRRRILEPADCTGLLDEGLFQLEQRQLTIPERDRSAWSAARLIIMETLPNAMRRIAV